MPFPWCNHPDHVKQNGLQLLSRNHSMWLMLAYDERRNWLFMAGGGIEPEFKIRPLSPPRPPRAPSALRPETLKLGPACEATMLSTPCGTTARVDRPVPHHSNKGYLWRRGR